MAVRCDTSGCKNQATHNWKGYAQCNGCAAPVTGRRSDPDTLMPTGDGWTKDDYKEQDMSNAEYEQSFTITYDNGSQFKCDRVKNSAGFDGYVVKGQVGSSGFPIEVKMDNCAATRVFQLVNDMKGKIL